LLWLVLLITFIESRILKIFTCFCLTLKIFFIIIFRFRQLSLTYNGSNLRIQFFSLAYQWLNLFFSVRLIMKAVHTWYFLCIHAHLVGFYLFVYIRCFMFELVLFWFLFIYNLVTSLPKIALHGTRIEIFDITWIYLTLVICVGSLFILYCDLYFSAIIIYCFNSLLVRYH